MHTVHAGCSFVAALLPDQKGNPAKTVLEGWQNNARSNGRSIFSDSTSTIFVSGVVIPEQYYNGSEKLPPTVMLLTSFCGPRKNHLNELIKHHAADLRDLFRHCKGFPATAFTCDVTLRKFLEKHRRSDTFYTGMQCITCTDIAREEELRKEIEKYIAANYAVLSTLTPLKVVANLKTHIQTIKGFSWVNGWCKKTIQDYWVLYKNAILFIVLFLGFLTFLIAAPFFYFKNIYFEWSGVAVFIFLIIFICYMIRYSERQSDKIATRPPDEVLRATSSTQIYPVINEMTVAGPLKKGWFRKILFWIVLNVVSYIRGTLIIPTIATARWLAIDGGRRLVFVSNFTNLTEFYIRDFIDNRASAMKINVIFGNGAGFPPTEWLFKKGVMDNPQVFMNSVFQTQHVTQFWYWPHKNLSVENINNNHKIRQGLAAKNMTEQQAQKWLHRIR